MSQATLSKSGIYVYGVAQARPFNSGGAHIKTAGIGERGDAVRTVEYGDLVAIVSDSPKQRYELWREHVLAHERVLEEAMTYSDIVPAAFSSVAASDKEVAEQLLKRRFDELHRHLEYVQGRAQQGLKVLWNRERLFSEVVEENDDIRALRADIAGQSEDATYYARIQLGELTEATIDLKRDEEVTAIMDALQPLAVDTRVNQNFMEMMILNAAFLVDRSSEAAFDEKVRAMGEAHAGRLTFHYVGPLPPYDFVTLRLHREE